MKPSEESLSLTQKSTISVQSPNLRNGSQSLLDDKCKLQLQEEASKKDNDGPRSTRAGVFHQIMLTSAVLVLAAGCGMPIGYSAVLLPQLYNSSDPSLSMDLELGSWFASVHSLASPIGSFVSGPIMDKYGRRPALMLSILPLLIGWTLLATSTSHIYLLAGRIVCGISVGLIGAPAQILIAECAEPRLRGLLIGAPFVSYSCGILVVYALGAYLHWRAVAFCGMVLPGLSLVALFLAPESPAWCARVGQMERASKALQWLRGDKDIASEELKQLVVRFENERTHHTANDGFFKSLTRTSVIKPMIIINGFHFLQILSGTYIVVFYAVDIIHDLGTDIDSMTAAVLTAAVRLVFTVVYCVMLLYVRRRSMVITSGIGSGLAAIVLGIFMYHRLDQPKTPLDLYVFAVCTLIYIAANTGFMAMPGIMIGELLPARIRGQMSGYIFTAFNIALFMVAKLFPALNTLMKTHGLFIMFGVASFGASILMYLMFPETKGKSLGEIEDYFQQNNYLWMNRKKTDKKSYA